MKQTISTDWADITYEDNPEIHKRVFDKLIEWYKEYEAFSGEHICQSDGPIIDSPNILAKIADDIIQFKSTEKN